MTDKKDQQNDGENKEENFTGSPEQQLPDLEAEDMQDESGEKVKDKRETDNQKEE